MLWWQKCIPAHILMAFVNILIFYRSVGLAVMSKLNVELLHLVFDMPTRLIASITLECNDAMTIYVHYLHPFQHIHLNYKNFKRSIGLAEISKLSVESFHWVLIFQLG